MNQRTAAGLLLVAFFGSAASAQDEPVVAPAARQAGDAPTVRALLQDLDSRHTSTRRKAVYALWMLGSGPTEGVETVGKALNDADDYVADVAGRILDRLGPSSAPAIGDIESALGDGRAKVRRAAARILWKMGDASKSVAPSLLPLIADPDPDVRLAAVDAISPMGQYGADGVEEIVSALARALDDEDPRVRRKAALGLSSFGDVIVIVRDAIVARLSDADADVRSNAANTLWALGRPATRALDRLHALLADPSALVRGRALCAVASIAPEDPRVVPALMAAAKDSDSDVRSMAVGFLGGAHATEPGVASILEAAVGDADPRVRRAAAGLLYKLGPAAVPALIAALRDPDSMVRYEACKGCREIGPPAARAAPFLVDALRGNVEEHFSSIAAQALGRIGGVDAADAIPDLRRIMKYPGSPVLRSECALAVWRLDPSRSGEVLCLLIEMTRDPSVGFWGSRVLGEMGPAAAVAVPDLSSQLDAAAYAARYAAAKALGQIGAGANAAVPRLERLLREDSDERIRVQAKNALDLIRIAQARVGP